MGRDNDSVPTPAAGMFVVILGSQRGHGGCEFIGERGSVGGRRESDLTVDSQRGQRFPGLVSGPGQIGDLANHSSGDGDEVSGRQPVGPCWIGRALAEGRRRHDVRPCRCEHHSFREASPGAFFHQANQVVVFKGAQVVVDLLAWQSKRGGNGGR